jgi:hypothetical protein
MPSRARVEAFIASVVGGDPVRAIADYYHEDASMQENLQAPRQGRAHLMAALLDASTNLRCSAGTVIALRRKNSSTTPHRPGPWSIRPSG